MRCWKKWESSNDSPNLSTALCDRTVSTAEIHTRTYNVTVSTVICTVVDIFKSVTVGGITANRAADNVFTRRDSFTCIVEFN